MLNMLNPDIPYSVLCICYAARNRNIEDVYIFLPLEFFL